MEYIALVSIIISLATVVALALLWQRLTKVERSLEVPVVKKLSADSKLKHHRKSNLYQGGAKIEDLSESEGQNKQNGKNRNQGRDNKSAPAKLATAAPTAANAPAVAEKNLDRNDKGGRRNNRRDSRRRFEASSEIVSNQEANSEQNFAPAPITPAPSIEIVKTETVENRSVASENTGRPALAPRGQRAESSENSFANTPVSTKSDEFDAPVTIDPSNIRHGRRNLVRKAPAIIEDGED